MTLLNQWCRQLLGHNVEKDVKLNLYDHTTNKNNCNCPQWYCYCSTVQPNDLTHCSATCVHILMQSAALQLLEVLKHLTSLHLGGAELLLPTTPYYPVGGAAAAGGSAAHDAAAAAATAGYGALEQQTAPLLGISILGQQQQQGGLVAAAVAAVSDRDALAASGGSGSGTQGDAMRRVLAAKSQKLEAFKLQFNCCGTGVEKASCCCGHSTAAISHQRL
jgi:hypothetical protein